MIRRTTTVAGILAILAAGVTACSGHPATGTPPPASAPITTTNASLPFAGAPKVPNPLPDSVLGGNPCADALTADQVKDALGTPTESKSDQTAGVGRSCSWYNHSTLGQISVGYNTETHTGLSGLFQNTKPAAALWKVLPPIQGFPAVAHSITKGADTSTTFCQVTVGLADDIAVDVSGFLGPAKQGKVDPCDVTAQAAGLVVTALSQKAGA